MREKSILLDDPHSAPSGAAPPARGGQFSKSVARSTSRYTATMRHHTIASSRVVEVGISLHGAKCAAAHEFRNDNQDFEIIIMDRVTGQVVSRRKVRDVFWINARPAADEPPD
jgi:hypothetical protein